MQKYRSHQRHHVRRARSLYRVHDTTPRSYDITAGRISMFIPRAVFFSTDNDRERTQPPGTTRCIHASGFPTGHGEVWHAKRRAVRTLGEREVHDEHLGFAGSSLPPLEQAFGCIRRQVVDNGFSIPRLLLLLLLFPLFIFFVYFSVGLTTRWFHQHIICLLSALSPSLPRL